MRSMIDLLGDLGAAAMRLHAAGECRSLEELDLTQESVPVRGLRVLP
jgi:hypothetical protein